MKEKYSNSLDLLKRLRELNLPEDLEKNLRTTVRAYLYRHRPNFINFTSSGEIEDTIMDGQQHSKELEEKHSFSSGATSSGQLPPYHFLSILFLRRTAERFKLGAEKHGAYNYRKGLKDKEFILDRLNHAIEHILKAQELIVNEQRFEDDDLGGVAVNIAMAMEYQEANNLIPKT